MSENVPTPLPVEQPNSSLSETAVWKRPKVLVLAVVAIVVIAAIVIVIVTLAKPKPFTLKGDIAAIDASFVSSPGDGSCSTLTGMDDIAEGAQVLVMDEGGKTLALGRLEAGQTMDGGGCDFPFRVDSIPAGQSFYKLEVTHSGSTQYREDELRAGVSLTLG